MSWLSIATARPESGARSTDLAPSEPADRERHWLAALRLPRIATPNGNPGDPVSS
jgi:hypothetical protein